MSVAGDIVKRPNIKFAKLWAVVVTTGRPGTAGGRRTVMALDCLLASHLWMTMHGAVVVASRGAKKNE